jgi:diaminopimelate epimerase
MELRFSKYHGTGNDFILINNLKGNVHTLSYQEIHFLCDRHLGIGGDGLMIIESSEIGDFKMRYYNADGYPGTMCGNGARCIVQFAQHAGIEKTHYIFEAPDGLHKANILENGYISVYMNPVNQMERNENVAILNTGSPHYVLFTDNVSGLNVFSEGKKIRNSERFQKEGINVNFVERISDKALFVRTYERGVEDETLSCGTGVTAAALSIPGLSLGKQHIDIETPGGQLSVAFEKITEQQFKNIVLKGPAQLVFTGTIQV